MPFGILKKELESQRIYNPSHNHRSFQRWLLNLSLVPGGGLKHRLTGVERNIYLSCVKSDDWQLSLASRWWVCFQVPVPQLLLIYASINSRWQLPYLDDLYLIHTQRGGVARHYLHQWFDTLKRIIFVIALWLTKWRWWVSWTVCALPLCQILIMD